MLDVNSMLAQDDDSFLNMADLDMIRSVLDSEFGGDYSALQRVENVISTFHSREKALAIEVKFDLLFVSIVFCCSLSEACLFTSLAVMRRI